MWRKKLIVLQGRGYHESAARAVWHLSYAGTIDAYPGFTQNSGCLSLNGLSNDEFDDEFMQAAPGEVIKRFQHEISHQMVGFCTNSQYLFQPEIFILTRVVFDDSKAMDDFLARFHFGNAEGFLSIQSMDYLNDLISNGRLRLRPLCKVAIETVYKKYLFQEGL